MGFEALNVERYGGLHGPVQCHETEHSSKFHFSLDLVNLFSGLIHTENAARQRKMVHTTSMNSLIRVLRPLLPSQDLSRMNI
jgi:hypothetical protein